MSSAALLVLFAVTSQTYDLPVGLLESLCFVESGHNPLAINKDDGTSSSIGICQVKLKTCQYMGMKVTTKTLFEPKTNIECSAKYLSYQFKRYKGDEAKAVTAYNKGHSSGTGSSVYYEKVTKQWEKRQREITNSKPIPDIR